MDTDLQSSSQEGTYSVVEPKLWSPQPGPQLAAFEATWVYELCYGGARGGGKSIYALLDYLQDVPTYGRHWQGIVVRNTYPELEQLIADSWKIYPQTGATYEKQPKTWHWPNGASLKFRNLENVEMAQAYQGHAYQWFLLEEGGNYPSPDVYFMMLATVRCGDASIPTMRARITANPGGPGHAWLKHRFVDPAPQGYTPIKSKGEFRERMYIPAKITDNKLLIARDPYYVENLKKQATPELVQAWLYGNWNIQVGSFFPEFSVDKHVTEPFSLPLHWTKFRSFDWGSAKPFSVHWWAVSDGTPVMTVSGKTKHFPRGSLICYRELYGMAKDRPNVGLGLQNEQIASLIVKYTGPNEKIEFTTTDSLPFQFRGGPMMAEIFQKNGVLLKRGNTDRITGWQQLRSRLQGNEEGPLIYFVNSCVHMIRTLPALQADKHKPEDVDSDFEDHAPDDGRLACMERLIVQDEEKPFHLKTFSDMTFNDLLKYDEMMRDDE